MTKKGFKMVISILRRLFPTLQLRPNNLDHDSWPPPLEYPMVNHLNQRQEAPEKKNRKNIVFVFAIVCFFTP